MTLVGLRLVSEPKNSSTRKENEEGWLFSRAIREQSGGKISKDATGLFRQFCFNFKIMYDGGHTRHWVT